MTAARSYLESARAAGNMYELDGHAYVAGLVTEPLSGLQQVLVEYCATELAGDPRLPAALADRFAPAERALVRTAAGAEFADYVPETTYLRYAATPDPVPEDILEATEDHEPLLSDWLVQAFDLGSAQRGRAARHARDAAAAVLRSPGRISYLTCTRQGQPVGHATLLTDAVDEVTGTPFAELLDSLVEPRHERGARTAGLVSACAHRARALGLPLFGHVVHTGDESDRILRTLCSNGWEPEYSYQTLSLRSG